METYFPRRILRPVRPGTGINHIPCGRYFQTERQRVPHLLFGNGQLADNWRRGERYTLRRREDVPLTFLAGRLINELDGSDRHPPACLRTAYLRFCKGQARLHGLPGHRSEIPRMVSAALQRHVVAEQHLRRKFAAGPPLYQSGGRRHRQHHTHLRGIVPRREPDLRGLAESHQRRLRHRRGV